MTPYQKHVAKWKDCRRCPLWRGRRQVVFARGKLPCDVLMVGEAPGQSENAIGEPFVGPAGHLLDLIVSDALSAMPAPLRVGFCNVVGCFPKEAKEEKADPPDEAIKACLPKLAEMVAIAKPKLVVAVGTLARDWTDPKRRGALDLSKLGVKRVIDIVHPAFILRSNEVQRLGMIRRCVVQLANAMMEVR